MDAHKVRAESEIELLLRARQGDLQACESLFSTYLKGSQSLEFLLKRALANPEDRQDMLHEIYLQLMLSRNTFRGESRLSTYIYQVARRTVFQKFRRENTKKRHAVHRVMDEEYMAETCQSNPEHLYIMKLQRQMLASLIESTPVAYRAVLRMRVLENLTYEEIAAKMEIPVNTVSTKIHKGRKLLVESCEKRR